jgi:anti-sigma regulatory factor (Ser/Thr protein kinase)
MVDRKRHILELLHGRAFIQPGEVAHALGITRQTAHRHLRKLVGEGVLVVEGAGRGTRYRRTEPVDARRYLTVGLEEDRVWAELSGPGSIAARLPPPAEVVLHYALTEMVNNAIDHSAASEVSVEVVERGGVVELGVEDQGIGIFRHLRERLDLESELAALQELSKGKTTTMPSHHSGEGIFFTSKAASRFEIRSGALRWIVDNRRHDMAVGDLDPPVRGTRVRVEIDPEAARDLAAVFGEFTDNLEFTRTRTIVRLFAIGTEFVSRSEAKRLVRGLERFREVVIDFEGVRLVGQGFADEVFRVWSAAHPEVRLIPVEMTEPIAFMVERARRAVLGGEGS